MKRSQKQRSRFCGVVERRGGARFASLLAAASICASVGLTSCVNDPEGIPTVAATEQPDIPAPINFEFDAARSYSYDPPTAIPEARFRSWCGYYRGEGDSGLLVPWYIKEMKKLGWDLQRLDDQAKKLTFVKGNEFAVVQMSREIDPKLAKYINVVKATVRPLGPEDFGVDENIGRLKEPSDMRGAEAQPATAPGLLEEEPDEGVRAAPVEAPYRSGEGAATGRSTLEEIDAYESGGP